MKTRVCSKCHIEKSQNEFYNQARSKSTWCKECHRQRERDFRKTEKYIEYRDSRHKGRFVLTEIEKISYDAWRNAYRKCMRNGMEFSLSRKLVDDLYKEFCEHNYHELQRRSPFIPSIDRIDNSKGYTDDNVRVIWLIENYAKNIFTDQDVIKFCRLKLGLE